MSIQTIQEAAKNLIQATYAKNDKEIAYYLDVLKQATKKEREKHV